MNSDVNNDPLHGKSLEVIMNYLVDEYGWEDLGNIIKINCFRMNPSVKSSLKFLNFFTLKNLNNKKISNLNNFYYQKTIIYSITSQIANI